MVQDEKLIQIGTRAWEFRKQNGFLKRLPEEFQIEVAELNQSGVSIATLSNVLGLPKSTVTDWVNRQNRKKVDRFSEVKVVENEISKFEVRLSTTVQGCRVEIFGSDYSLLQRLLRKMGP